MYGLTAKRPTALPATGASIELWVVLLSLVVMSGALMGWLALRRRITN
ncbi:MAG: LPXTG cell wall anchor domain-containing protein [Chloroflexi bacterium]|nr:LPXTG cell wall anchor domain-containing protein [Chloroflexota bacterium]